MKEKHKVIYILDTLLAWSEMLTREQLRVIFHVHRLFTKIGFYPCSLDFKTGELRAQQSTSRWRLWWFFLSLVTCRAVLGTLRCISAFVSPERTPPDEVPFMINQLLFWPAVHVILTSFYKNMDVTTSIFNSLLQGKQNFLTINASLLKKLI